MLFGKQMTKIYLAYNYGIYQRSLKTRIVIMIMRLQNQHQHHDCKEDITIISNIKYDHSVILYN